MHRVVRYWAALMVLPLFCHPGFSSAQPSGQIRVRVYNYAHARAKVIAESKEVAARVLRQAGVSKVWIDCPLTENDRPLFPECQQPFTPADVTLNFVSNKPQDESRDAFGMAVLSERASVHFIS
jgi:hypothetical protein